MIVFNSTVLPQPLSPITARVWPRGTASEMSRNTACRPNSDAQARPAGSAARVERSCRLRHSPSKSLTPAWGKGTGTIRRNGPKAGTVLAWSSHKWSLSPFPNHLFAITPIWALAARK